MPTFAWRPTVGPRLLRKPRVTKVQFGDGYAQRQADGLNADLQRWELTFARLPDVTAKAIDDFLVAQAAAEAFDWTPPGYPAGRFVCEDWTREQSDIDDNIVRATFEQVPA